MAPRRCSALAIMRSMRSMSSIRSANVSAMMCSMVKPVWSRRPSTCLTRSPSRPAHPAAPDRPVPTVSSLIPPPTVQSNSTRRAPRGGERVKQVEGLLDQTGFTMEHIIAETLADRIDDIERIDRMIASAEQRRGAMLREVDRHRASLAARLRLASDEVVQAEFEDVSPGHAQ